MVGNISITTPRFALAKDEEHGPNANASINANPPDNNGNNGNNNGNNGNNNGNNGNNGNDNNGNNGNNGNNNGNNGDNGNNNGNNNENNNGNNGEQKITICHVPPGNPSNAHAITIGLPGWLNGHEPHKAHKDDFVVDGDRPCPPHNGGGGNSTPTPTPTPGGTGGGSSSSSSSSSNSSSSSSSGGVGGTNTEKQGQILGAATLASTGVFTDILSSGLQLFGFVLTIYWSIRYGASKKASA